MKLQDHIYYEQGTAKALLEVAKWLEYKRNLYTLNSDSYLALDRVIKELYEVIDDTWGIG